MKHKNYAVGARIRLAKRKDRNVFRSSHGKFASVADLVKHQQVCEKERL